MSFENSISNIAYGRGLSVEMWYVQIMILYGKWYIC